MRPERGDADENSSERKRHAKRQSKKSTDTEAQAYFLPIFAKVVELRDNGYGFAEAIAGQRLFFHRNAGIRREDFDALKHGDALLVLVGSDPRRPDRTEIVRWAATVRVNGLDRTPEDQASWDAMRRAWLQKRLQRLDSVLRPNWYIRKWGAQPAPANLEDDLLRELVFAHIGGMDAEEIEGTDLLQISGSALYKFAPCLDRAKPDAVALLDYVPEEHLPLLGRPGPRVLDHASEEQRATVVTWFLRSGGAEATDQERTSMLTGKNTWETLAASRLLAFGIPHGPGLARWFRALRDNNLLPVGFADAVASVVNGVEMLRYVELLSDAQREALFGATATNGETRVQAMALRPDLAADIALRAAVALDLETDGRTTRQIGVATSAGNSLLFDGDDPEARVQSFETLGRQLSKASFVIGHNILAWDLPILEQNGIDPLTIGLVWDTLHVEALLDPRAVSHALGGAHRADVDAADALALFHSQLARLPDTFSASFLTAPPRSSAALVRRIAQALADTPLEPAQTPPWVADAAPGRHRPILAPRHAIDDLAWTSGVDVVPAPGGESLPVELLVVDATALQADAAFEPASDPKAALALALAKRCAAAGIPLRVSMVWNWLANGSVDAAIRRAAQPAAARADQVCLLPPAGPWWDVFDAKTLRVLSWTGEVRSLPVPPSAGNASHVRLAPLAALAWDEAVKSWTQPDPVAERLDASFRPRRFGIAQLPAQAVVSPDRGLQSPVPLVPKRTGFRRGPWGFDAASYWTEVVGEVVGLADRREVRALLVGSSRSNVLVSLLQKAIAEIGHGEAKSEHVSRGEHLKRASRSGGTVVFLAEEWRDWHRLALAQGIVLRPIVEALPVEEWHALARSKTGATEVHPDHYMRDEIGSRLIDSSRAYLSSWLHESGLADARVEPVILDPRASDLLRPLRGLLAPRPVLPALSEEDSQRLAVILEPLAIRREPAPSDLGTMQDYLVAHWQPSGGDGNAVTAFKSTQNAAMKKILRRQADVVVTLPTGEGKSVLFQVPALCRGLRDRRLTLVLSPLRALMRDQVERLRLQGFDASVDYLNADRPKYERTEALQGLLDHRIVLLYVAPERLRDPVFSDVLRRRIAADQGLERLVLDEAHCLNQWGFEFRPDYFFAVREVLAWAEASEALVLAETVRATLVKSLPGQAEPAAPVLMLSATHTAADRDALGLALQTARGTDRSVPLVPVPKPEDQPHPLREHIEVHTEEVQRPILEKREFAKGIEERMPHLVATVSAARENSLRTGQRSGILIFVTRRTHAESVALAVAQATGATSEAFHAGLGAGLREEIVDEFREGRIDVLVATKAFGMGMDIPDIHYVVHLSPPAYLEDYLQEVGRIGRGKREREEAKLDRLPATLLWAASDFATARDLRKQNELSEASIRAFHSELRKRATGGRAILPAHGFEEYTGDGHKRALETQCRMSLHWLEETGRVEIVNLTRSSIPSDLHIDALRRIAEETGAAAEAAGHLLAVHGEEALSDDEKGRRALIDVVELSRACGHAGTDDAINALLDLRDRRAIEIEWNLSVDPLRLWKQPPEQIDLLIDVVEVGIGRLIAQATTKGAEIDSTTLMEEIGAAFEQDEGAFSGGSESQRLDFRQAWTWAVKSLALSCDVSLRQFSRPDGLVWRVRLESGEKRKAIQRAEKLLLAVRELITRLRREGAKPEFIDAGMLVGLLKQIHRGFRSRDLEATLRLASALRQVAIRDELLPSHYEVALKGDGDGLDGHQDLADRLASVNAHAEARLIVMEAYCGIPEASRDAFVKDYMACRDAAEIETFLVQHLGSVSEADSGRSTFVENLLRRYRGEAVKEHFARFEKSEEPAQWKAITHPYNRPMLVNAGPGAGKTAVLVARIVHLLHVQGLKPSEILVLAFNRAVVQEIRARVAAVFHDLGYGAYTRDLRVQTFHALATRHLPEGSRRQDANSLDALNNHLRLRVFRAAEVAAGCRCILVDEFQDANDAIFGIVESLFKASGAGVFAIGDDDQDITRWNRACGSFSGTYFERFEKTFETRPDDRCALTVNFRSGRAIVEGSEHGLAATLHRSPVSGRLKRTALRARKDAAPGEWHVEDCRDRSWHDLVAFLQQDLAGYRRDRSIAILCRSNAEVDRLRKPLAAALPGLRVQKRSEILNVADCRHVGLWLDLLDSHITQQDRAATPEQRDALLDEFRGTIRIPETQGDSKALRDLRKLWNCVLEEDRDAGLSDVANFLRSWLRPDDVDRLVGRGATRVLSTIHKVKGLEFDDVIVMPSTAAFPMGGGDLERAAAEEARVLYVAETRAKKRLLRLQGDREAAWIAHPPRPSPGGDDGQFLRGSGAEIDLGWTADGRGFNADPVGLHEYIEERVAVGDPLCVGGVGGGAGRALLHVDGAGKRTQVGFLASKTGRAGQEADLRVAAVVRFVPDAPPRWADGRAWTYAVLVEGRLR